MSSTLLKSTDLTVEETVIAGRKHCLVAVFQILPGSYEKSAHMLMFRQLVQAGCQVVVVVVGGEDHVEEWCGIRVVQYRPRSLRWRLAQPLHVLRAQAAHARVAQSPIISKIVSCLSKPLASWLSFPDRHGAARREMARRVTHLCRTVQADVVLSLYHPISSHHVAREAACKIQLPWIAMTKDFFSWPDELRKGVVSRVVNRWKRRYERASLRGAKKVLAVNDNIRDYLRDVVKPTPVGTLAHCFADESLEQPLSDAPRPGGVFRIVSVGKVAPSERGGLSWLFQGVAKLLHDGDIQPEDFQFRFVGFGSTIVRQCATAAGIESIVECSEQLPHAEAMHELTQASCLLFQQARWGNRRRLAEYFAARKPIFAFPSLPQVMSEKSLQAYRGAVIVEDWSDAKDCLLAWYRQFVSTGSIQIDLDESVIHQWSSQHRAAELAASICEVIAEPRQVYPA